MTGNEASVQQSIITFFKEHLHVDVLSPDYNLIEAGILDSLMIVDLVLYLEQTFQVSPSLEDLEVENFATVARVAAMVAAHHSRSAFGNTTELRRRSSVA
jgi:methoxymalonate biosynthesis acyl carrier protein